ncbi:MAG: rubredoxin [Proteobacteria bacterium]|nr:rubredoxin [Pseudomonadota bacterium]
MEQYKCTVCGWIYDEKPGYPDGGIDPGTKFQDLPEYWICPFCGNGAEKFERVTG